MPNKCIVEVRGMEKARQVEYKSIIRNRLEHLTNLPAIVYARAEKVQIGHKKIQNLIDFILENQVGDWIVRLKFFYFRYSLN